MMDMLTLDGNFVSTLTLFWTIVGVLIAAIGVFYPILKEIREKKRSAKNKRESDDTYKTRLMPDKLSQEEDTPQQSPNT